MPPLDEESYRLWPHLRNPEPTAAELAAVRAQWAEFAQLYPDNIYLPREFQKPKSEAEIKAAKERLDKFTDALVEYNALRSATKWLGPGEKPPPITLSAEQMVAVLDYKILEMQSRLQLMDHYLKNGSPDAEKLARAQQDIAQWKKELNEMQQAKANVPVR